MIYGPKYRVFFVTSTGTYIVGILKNGVYADSIGEFLTEKDASKFLHGFLKTKCTLEKESCLAEIAEQMDKEPPKRRIRKLIV